MGFGLLAVVEGWTRSESSPTG